MTDDEESSKQPWKKGKTRTGTPTSASSVSAERPPPSPHQRKRHRPSRLMIMPPMSLTPIKMDIMLLLLLILVARGASTVTWVFAFRRRPAALHLRPPSLTSAAGHPGLGVFLAAMSVQKDRGGNNNNNNNNNSSSSSRSFVAQPQERQPSTRPRNFICVGGSSGMGKAAALECLRHGGTVLLVSRSQTKLEAARQELIHGMRMRNGYDGHDDDDDDDIGGGSSRIQIAAVDVTNETAVQELAETLLLSSSPSSSSSSSSSTTMTTSSDTSTPTSWDALIISVADRAPHGPMLTLPTEDTRFMMETKVWTAYHCAKHLAPVLIKLSSLSSLSSTLEGVEAVAQDAATRTPAVVFVAGILNRRPGLNCVPLAMANGALEGLTRALALEWGPALRVNCMSPGFCDTERFQHMDPHRKAAMMANTAASLPLQRVGRPSDMGEALWYLATAEFCTGVVLDVDGGHGVRQYASATNDPMRSSDGIATAAAVAAATAAASPVP